MKKKLISRLPLLPLAVFGVIAFVLYLGLSQNPNKIPSPLIGKPAPDFNLPALMDPDRTVSKKDLLGHITLLNIWASWCDACMEEHDFLNQLANDHRFYLIGFNYRDSAKDARAWLNQRGNPYRLIAEDASGKIAIDWGIYGTPETYLIDKNGVIRYRQIGVLTKGVWQNVFEPLLDKLEKE